MPHFDLSLEKLQEYVSLDPEPADFDEFWASTLAETAAFPLDAQFLRMDDTGFQAVEVFDVTFSGYMGQRIKGWLITPRNPAGKLPCLIRYLGYGGGRGLPGEHLVAPVSGFAFLVMDTRGQGSVWAQGATPDEVGSGPQFPGFLTRGIESRETYYYRRVFADAARAVEAAAAHEYVDANRIGTSGGSQGGALALAAAALAPGCVKVVTADVPFLSNFRRAVSLLDTMPYAEITGYLKVHRGSENEVFRVLDYFDVSNHARRIKARAMVSVGLMDNICPPSTIYAAYNAIQSPKEMRAFPYNAHEGGGGVHELERLRFARQWL